MPCHWTKVGGKQAPAELKLKQKHKHSSSSSPGKSKGIRPSPEDKCLAKQSRSYKRGERYERWKKKYNGSKQRKAAK